VVDAIEVEPLLDAGADDVGQLVRRERLELAGPATPVLRSPVGVLRGRRREVLGLDLLGGQRDPRRGDVDRLGARLALDRRGSRGQRARTR